MAKFLTLWETDTTRIPDSPEEQIRYYTMLVNMIKDDLKTGKTLEFGMFAGGLGGYVIREGTEQEIHAETMKYSPQTTFKTYPVLSISQLEEMLKVGSRA